MLVQFVETNKELLSELPPPLAAAAYYRNEDLYMVRGVRESCEVLEAVASSIKASLCGWLAVVTLSRDRCSSPPVLAQ